LDKTYAEILHARTGNSVLAWTSVAPDILAAANVLKERVDSFDLGSVAAGDSVPREALLGHVVLMLRGMAVECLLKGLCLKRGNELVVDGKYSRVPGASDHNLCELASAVDFNVDYAEEAVLRRLSLFVQYGGRYPIPKSAVIYGQAATTWATPSDENVFNELVRRLDRSLE